MCGLYAYDGPVLDRGLLLQAACAARRGPHGFGWVSGGRSHYSLGPFAPDSIPDPLPEPWILGHSRLATVGDGSDVLALQPIDWSGHTLAHNGHVHNWTDLDPDAFTDSHALAHCYAVERYAGYPPIVALSRVLARCQHSAYAVIVRDRDGTLLGKHHRLPLHYRQLAGGCYLSSVPFGGSRPIPEATTLTHRPPALEPTG